MATRRLTIKQILRDNPISIVSPNDFVWEAGAEIEPMQIATDPRFTLYCFDLETAAAIFVESDDPIEVDRAVFYYQGQIEHAVGLVSMPLETFRRTAQAIAEPPNGLIFVHSVGRCGSTLISKVLDAVPTVHSLSEPDDLTQLAGVRSAGEVSDDVVSDLLSSSIKWRCKPRCGAAAQFVAIKPRSEVMMLADLVGSMFPKAKHFFLYRNGVSWSQTIFRGFTRKSGPEDVELNRKMEEAWSRMIPLVRELRKDNAPMNPVQIRILCWSACMEAYLLISEMPIPTCAARFEDIVSNPIPVLESFFEFCEINTVDWSAISEVLGRDSQAGSMYAREERHKQTRQLTPDLIQDIYDMVATRPLLRKPEVILPGTIRLN